MFEIYPDLVTIHVKGKRPGPAGFRFDSMNPALAILRQDAFAVLTSPQPRVPGKFKFIRADPGTSQEFITGRRNRRVSIIATVASTIQADGFCS